MIPIVTELAPNFQTVIDFVCDDSFRNHYHETVMYQQDSCSSCTAHNSFFKNQSNQTGPKGYHEKVVHLIGFH